MNALLNLLRFTLLLLFLFTFPLGCSGEPETENQNQGDTDGDSDSDSDSEGESDSDGDGEPQERLFCDQCSGDQDCSDPGARCITLFAGERICGSPCETSEACPEGAFCATLDGELRQCIPEDLTCVDRCSDLACPSGQFCDPITGECAREARICDVGCQFDSECGDRDRFRCISTGAADGETICTRRCNPNPPAGSDPQCPTDFFCGALSNNEEEGVCVPFEGTCTDRCLDANCPAGQNCDPFTGACVEPTTGACDRDCTSNADCGGQEDICLNVGIGEGPHCWRNCTESQSCPDGYECQTFVELSQSLCLPLGQQCQTCYDSDCFPHGICNPSTGECMPHPEDCTLQGCDENQLCEPASRRCVDLDRSCQGSSWAADCDNVITRCTTRRANTEGICATLCIDDSDCSPGRTCQETQNGNLCLQEDLGGPMHCGILNRANTSLGRPCGQGGGNCFQPTFCLETGEVPGFCAQSCGTNESCPSGSTCNLGPDGAPTCIPNQCACAADPLFSGTITDGVSAGLQEGGVTQCDLVIDKALFEASPLFDPLYLTSQIFQDRLANPLAAMGFYQSQAEELLFAESASEILQKSGALLDFSPTTPVVDLFDGTFLEALQAFVDAAGGTVDLADVTSQVADLPGEVEQLAARLLHAQAQAYGARQALFTSLGLSEEILEELFEKTHRLLLPHDTSQAALDLDDPDLLQALEDFPLEELLSIAITLAAHVEAAVDAADIDAADLAAPFEVVIETDGGLILLGDGQDTLYDPLIDPRLGGPIALLLDIGGDDTYKIPLGANQSLSNGVSLAVDLGGNDTYTYEVEAHALDNFALLPSDEGGRKTPQGAVNQFDQAVSLSEVGRQGLGRLGIGMLFDFGEGDDTYETLRLGQGAAILGVGLLFDDGGQDSFEAEAFAQGAGLRGLGVLFNQDGDDSYRLWHAGQGFGSALGLGLLLDQGGSDHYQAVRGIGSPEALLYLPPVDRGNSNLSRAQGASSRASSLGGGLGLLLDQDGNDFFEAAIEAQGFGSHYGLGLLYSGAGDDTYEGRAYAQGVGQLGGAGLFIDLGGNDEFNLNTSTRQLGQGAAEYLGWSLFLVDGGVNEIEYMAPGGAVAFDGGITFALFGGISTDHRAVGASMGLATLDLPESDPLRQAWTAAFFLQTGGGPNTYQHPVGVDLGIEANATWRQNPADTSRALGVGIDLP